MLNMFIAIMGDTHTRITESKKLNLMKTKIQVLDDVALVLETKTKDW